MPEPSHPETFDVAVVGAGPGGSTAAAALAAAGARVALIDKAAFPRDKACGDMIGPRGVALLSEVGVELKVPKRLVGDMLLVGPTGGRMALPAESGDTYPGNGWLVSRRDLDNALFEHALSFGAEPVTARMSHVEDHGGGYSVWLDDGRRLETGAVIGADGATTQVGRDLGMVDEDASLYGFAVRAYLEETVPTPVISLFRDQGALFPGYGWLFADVEGRANFGVGVGVFSDRKRSSMATQALPRYLELLKRQGWISAKAEPARRLGGWLKMGGLGVDAARGRALLVGDAAGLVNPLQGEGIHAAMDSGLAAARALLGTGDPTSAYLEHLRNTHLPFARAASALQRIALGHPRLAETGMTLLTSRFTPGIVGSAWGLYWNDLLRGAGRVRGAGLARAMAAAVETITLAAPERQVRGA